MTVFVTQQHEQQELGILGVGYEIYLQLEYLDSDVQSVALSVLSFDKASIVLTKLVILNVN